VKQLLIAACAAALTLVAAGCGGTAGAGAPDGAAAAPASAAAFVWVDTDLKSNQVDQAQALLDRFPGRAQLLDQIDKQLSKKNLDFNRDVKPALGDELDAVWLDFANNGDDVVGMLKPRNEQKFAALLKAGDTPTYSDKYQGWTIFAGKRALLDRFKSAAAKGSLADDDAFTKAFGTLDSDSIARAYVSGDALQSAYVKSLGDTSSLGMTPGDFLTFGPIVADAKAESSGVRVDGSSVMHTKLNPNPTSAPYTAKLADELPAGALLYVSTSQLDREIRATVNAYAKANPSFKQQEAQVEGVLGTSLEHDIYPLIDGEAAFAIYPAKPLPAFEFVLAVKDEQKARRLLTKVDLLLSFSGQYKPQTVAIAGAHLDEVKVPGKTYSIFYGVADHKLVVTNARSAVAALLGGGKRLSDDPLFKAARDGAGASGKTIGFVYADLRDGLPVAFDYARQTGSVITPTDVANTKPLQSAFLSFTRDGDTYDGSGFAGIK
jgi:hypothetical protein